MPSFCTLNSGVPTKISRIATPILTANPIQTRPTLYRPNSHGISNGHAHVCSRAVPVPSLQLTVAMVIIRQPVGCQDAHRRPHPPAPTHISLQVLPPNARPAEAVASLRPQLYYLSPSSYGAPAGKIIACLGHGRRHLPRPSDDPACWPGTGCR